MIDTLEPVSFLLGVIAALLVLVPLAIALFRARSATARREGAASREAELLAERRLGEEIRQALESRLTEANAALAAERSERLLLLTEKVSLETRLAGLAPLAERTEALSSQLEQESELRSAGAIEVARIRAQLEATEHLARERGILLENADRRLRDAFQNLATQILEDKTRRFTEHNSQQIGGLLEPLKTQLKEFREAVERSYADDQRQRGMLAQEIHTLKQLNERISEDAINLTRALKGDTQMQGAWGELVLERVLEASGLEAGREYETQISFGNDEGGRLRPDVLVHLPDNKDLVVDAKVSLVTYERFIAAPDAAARELALREHVASFKRHIEGLANRRYTDLPGLRTLDFVLMFVPVEAAFIEAVRHDSGLYAYALARNIALVSPGTLLATLRTVAHLWKLERRNLNAVEIARRAGLLHDNFVLLAGELENIGSQLEKAQKAHATALRRLTEGGKGSVLLQVQSLKEMGAQASRSLPSGLLEKAGASTIEPNPTGEQPIDKEDPESGAE